MFVQFTNPYSNVDYLEVAFESNIGLVVKSVRHI